jgi:probable addiction module antidote protein
MLKTKKWDILDYLKTEKDIQGYLNAALAEGDPVFAAVAFGDVAKARKLMRKAAKKAEVARESLYQSVSPKGSPQFKTIMGLVDALGFRLAVAPRG